MGDEVRLEIWRDGQVREVSVTPLDLERSLLSQSKAVVKSAVRLSEPRDGSASVQTAGLGKLRCSVRPTGEGPLRAVHVIRHQGWEAAIRGTLHRGRLCRITCKLAALAPMVSFCVRVSGKQQELRKGDLRGIGTIVTLRRTLQLFAPHKTLRFAA